MTCEKCCHFKKTNEYGGYCKNTVGNKEVSLEFSCPFFANAAYPSVIHPKHKRNFQMETDKKKCDSCAETINKMKTCNGTHHPEHGFCFEDMLFCNSCLNKKGYCDWCEKKLGEMKSVPDVKHVPMTCA